MIKHIGRHNNRKVVVVYRTVPNEDHMALIVYSDNLPSLLHDEVMKVLESAPGQNAKELADALFRNVMADGSNCLETLYRGSYLKKVPTKQIIVTVNATSACRLDELNDILKQMEQGEDAVKKLANLDANQGFAKTTSRDVGEPVQTAAVNNTSVTDVLSDADIAKQRLEQATRMEAEAKGLLAEAKRLKAEAAELKPAKAKAPAKAKITPAKATDGRTTKTKKATA